MSYPAARVGGVGETAAYVLDEQQSPATETRQLTADEARRLTLYAQGFLGGGRRGGVAGMLHRVGAVQLDTISVLARSHELVAYARLGPVGRNAVENAYWPAKKPTTFEYWAHAACVLPLELWPYYAWRRRSIAARGQRWHKVSEDVCEEVLARLRSEGPLTATQLGGAKGGGPWWDWSEVKIAAEWLLDTGRAVCVRRTGWRRVYDLPERAIPMPLLELDPDDGECVAYLAGVTKTIRLGTLVTGITYRNIAHLAKIIATLDVLSGGRAMCGIGAGWHEREHKLYGWRFPPLRERYALLEDALELLPLMWGPGSPRFEGRTLTVSDAICYPRPLQQHVPILVGGSGEHRTLRLVARHADACNLFGDPDTIRHKLAVLRAHCDAEGRDPAAIEVSHAAPARVVASESDRSGQGAGTVQEHIGRYRELAEAGVQRAIVSVSDTDGADSVKRFSDVIAAFRT